MTSSGQLVDRYPGDIQCVNCGDESPKDCWHDPELIDGQDGFDCPACGVQNRFDIEDDGYDDGMDTKYE